MAAGRSGRHGLDLLAITRLNLQPGAIRITVVTAAAPPVVTAAPTLRLGCDHSARGCADHGSCHCTACAVPDRAADNAADRTSYNRSCDRILRCGLLRGHYCRHAQ